jgi:hypothetical protein
MVVRLSVSRNLVCNINKLALKGSAVNTRRFFFGGYVRKVYIGIPAGGSIMVNTVISLLATQNEFRDLGWPKPTIYFRVGDSDLCRARNAIIGKFLESDCTDLMLIDSDISWPIGAISTLVECEKDFVAASYRGRTDDKDIYFVLWPDKKEMWTSPRTGTPLLKVDGVTIGFCRLTRACVEKMVDSLNGDFTFDPLCPDEKIPWLIDFERGNGVRYEEGYSLCRKWRNLGGDVWVDPMINLGHMGPKVFEGNLIEFLDKMRKYTSGGLDIQGGAEFIENAITSGLEPIRVPQTFTA